MWSFVVLFLSCRVLCGGVLVVCVTCFSSYVRKGRACVRQGRVYRGRSASLVGRICGHGRKGHASRQNKVSFFGPQADRESFFWHESTYYSHVYIYKYININI